MEPPVFQVGRDVIMTGGAKAEKGGSSVACLTAEYRLSEKGPHPAERSIVRALEGFSAM